MMLFQHENFSYIFTHEFFHMYWPALGFLAFPQGSAVKNPPAMQEPLQEKQVWPLGWKDRLEEGMATHSSILAWRIPWTEEPGGLLCETTGSQRVRHDWSNLARVHFTLCCGEGPSFSLIHWSLNHWCGFREPYFLTAYNALCPPLFWPSNWSRTGHWEPLPAAAPSLCPIIFIALGYFLAKQNVQHLFKLWVKSRHREEKRKEEKESRVSGEETDERECGGRLGSTGPSERGGPAPSLPQRAEPGPRETKRTLCYASGGNKVCILLMILLGADDRNPTWNRRRERKSENLLAYKPENNGVSTQLCSVAATLGLDAGVDAGDSFCLSVWSPSFSLLLSFLVSLPSQVDRSAPSHAW